MFKLFIIYFFVTSALAQDMKQSLKTTDSKKVPTALINLLNDDTTDQHTYVNGKFYCHNFASTFYLQRSSLVVTMDAFDLKGIKVDWGVVIERLAETSKMPIYYVSLSNEESGFYHAINAYLVNPEKPSEISSYIFIEPQTDETFITSDILYDRYRKYYDKSPAIEEVLHVKVSTLSSIKMSQSGTAFQTWTDAQYEFDVKIK